MTGSGGLVGGAVVSSFCEAGHDVVGIDNDLRSFFFGKAGSTAQQTETLVKKYPNFRSYSVDIRDESSLGSIFRGLSRDIFSVIHCAAQPSHDWAARDPVTDFTVNANGTLNLLELTRKFAETAPFVFMSTNKVYGDAPNRTELKEEPSRWTPEKTSQWVSGYDESLSIDQCTHSLFGASKAAADLLVQEYGRYFGMNTVVFRGGCLTGPNHAGVELHGFLSYLVKCVIWGQPYTVFGHKAKQVRDNIHTKDLVSAFWRYVEDPMPGEVFNIGGGLEANVSMIEAIRMIEELAQNKLTWEVKETARTGDHRWYVSDLSRFKNRFPGWSVTRGIPEIVDEMVSYEQHNKNQA